MECKELGFLQLADLTELAKTAIDDSAPITKRIAAYEAIAARTAEAAELWNGYSAFERSTIRAAFAIDADAMARRGFTSTEGL